MRGIKTLALLAAVSIFVAQSAICDAATYYVSSGVGPGAQTAGDDNNPGTEAQPFQTVTKGAGVLQSGDTLMLRGGEYDTANGLTLKGTPYSLIPSGKSWDNPTTIKAYAGEKPVLRRTMPPNAKVDEITYRNSWHMPTYEEAVKAKCAGRYPYSAWTADCYDGTLMEQSAYAGQGPEVVLKMGNDRDNPLQFVVLDGVDIDARGICDPIIFYDGVSRVRFSNCKISNAIHWAVAQLCMGNDSTTETDFQFINVTFTGCGVPYDTTTIDDGEGRQILARKHPLARFRDAIFIRTGGTKVINCEITDCAGVGLGLDGNHNVITGNYIHDNSNMGMLVSGGGFWQVSNNVIYNSGGAGISVQNGGGHFISNNTIVAGSPDRPNPEAAGIVVKDSAGTIFENNIISGFPYGVVNYSTSPQPSVFRNNLLFCSAQPNRNRLVVVSSYPNAEILNVGAVVPALCENNILGKDPLFLNPSTQDFRLAPESPAIDAGFNNWILADRKGTARPLGGAIDIGAYECIGADKTLAQNSSTTTTAAGQPASPSPSGDSRYGIPVGADAIVDNLDNSDSKKLIIVSGDWTTASAAGSYAGGYAHAPAVTGLGNAHAKFICTTLPAGQYDVYAWWPLKSDNATNVAIEITHAGGLSTTRINQAQSGAHWTLIGRFNFDAGKHAVDIYNSDSKPGEKVCADAVRFIAAGTAIDK